MTVNTIVCSFEEMASEDLSFILSIALVYNSGIPDFEIVDNLAFKLLEAGTINFAMIGDHANEVEDIIDYKIIDGAYDCKRDDTGVLTSCHENESFDDVINYLLGDDDKSWEFDRVIFIYSNQNTDVEEKVGRLLECIDRIEGNLEKMG